MSLLSKQFFFIFLVFLFVLTPVHSLWAVEYQRPPFELQGRMEVPDEYHNKNIAMHMFEGAWSSIKINVYKDYFSGYYRYVNPKDENHIVLLTITGKYDRGYLVGTWEYSSVDQSDDKAHGPYPQVYEGLGTFVSDLVESKTENIIPANVEGTLTYNFGDLDPKGEPGKAAWIQREESLTFKARWEGKLLGELCGGPDVDQYVGKAIETGKIFHDYSGKAKIMHCGLADGTSAVKWEKVKGDGELIYVSDRLYYDSNGVTILEVYDPEALKERKADPRWGMLPGEVGEPPQVAGYTYTFGGTFSGRGENPGSGVIVFLHPPRGETKLGLVMGRLWTNTKSLLLEGTMKMETSQAVAGIKGTNFILGSDDPKITELMVLEGTVEFTAKADGKTIMVNPGQKVVATEKGMGEIESFDPAPLLAEYKIFESVQQPIVEEDYTAGPAPEGAPTAKDTDVTRSERKNSESGSNIHYAFWIALFAAVIGGVWVVKRKKNS